MVYPPIKIIKKMSRLILPIILVLFALNVQSQNFSFDNVNFSTISWDDFFKRLDSSPNLIFFDIRTPGERADTSQFSSYNQGKIKGAKETDYSDFDRYYPEYKKYKSDTIYLYCSHSRRSRRLAKRPVSYTHLDVYKRQLVTSASRRPTR